MNLTSSLLDNLNYGTILLLMLIESTVIPFPSEIVVAPAAYHAAAGYQNVFLVVLFATIGADLGATINYAFAYYLGRPLVYRFVRSRWGKLCLLSEEKVKKSEKYFDDHGVVATLTGRLLPVIRQLISVPAGLAKMNFGKFILYIFLAVVLGVGGYLTWKTLLNPSSHRKQMRKLTKPGFDELVLEPLYYAFSDEDEFDSSLSIDMDESALDGWKDDLKKRRRYILVFIASVWILVGLSSFVPNSWIYDKVVAPVMEQTETPAAQEEIKDLITVQSLNPGDKGENVRKMQQFLIRKGYLKSAADGDYGTNTRLAVRTFQRANGIKVTGKADKRTIRKINELAAKENIK